MIRLEGLRVLITRPAGRAEPLVNAITAAGGEGVTFPVMEIAVESAPELLQFEGKPLESGALVIFVSVYAARALEAARELGVALPEDTTIAAIGAATAAALHELGLPPHITPEDGENSEGLLRALEPLDMTGRQVLILRGQSGRELLSRELEKRGARVVQRQCYTRSRIVDPPLDPLEYWLASPDGVVTITSVAIMQALVRAVPNEHLAELRSRSVVTLSDRIATACRSAGFSGCIEVAAGTDPKALLQAIARAHDAAAGG